MKIERWTKKIWLTNFRRKWNFRKRWSVAVGLPTDSDPVESYFLLRQRREEGGKEAGDRWSIQPPATPERMKVGRGWEKGHEESEEREREGGPVCWRPEREREERGETERGEEREKEREKRREQEREMSVAKMTFREKCGAETWSNQKSAWKKNSGSFKKFETDRSKQEFVFLSEFRKKEFAPLIFKSSWLIYDQFPKLNVHSQNKKILKRIFRRTIEKANETFLLLLQKKEFLCHSFRLLLLLRLPPCLRSASRCLVRVSRTRVT